MPDTPDQNVLPKKPVTLLAFDFGTGQIGIAVGQSLTGSANPLTVIKARNGVPDWDQIGRLLAEWQPDQLVVGLPLNMDGSESAFCRRARKFARRLNGRFGLKVTMVDERLSTFEAKEQSKSHSQRHTGSYRQSPVDDLAAVLILNTWLSDPTLALDP
ncbi:Holliday junction resolvase RuvX [Porticoccus sp.]|uniref:Holliday junction resolvase RuvX n=1 Tax=Porticoccus sp. TaxID=2024853 RepID=UPI003F69C3E6